MRPYILFLEIRQQSWLVSCFRCVNAIEMKVKLRDRKLYNDQFYGIGKGNTNALYEIFYYKHDYRGFFITSVSVLFDFYVYYVDRFI